jgi:hypothetical protein
VIPAATLIEAAILADHLAGKAAIRATEHDADIGTAESALSALGSAGACWEAEQEARKWQAVAAKLRAAAVGGVA